MDIAELAALAHLFATAIVVGFQLLLGLGVPWGAYAMGGRFPGRFPPRMRVIAVVQAVVLSLLALVVLSAAGVIAPDLTAGLTWLIFIVVAINAVRMPSIREVLKARITTSLLARVSNQRNDKPSIGKPPNCEELNDSSTTTATGVNMKR